MAAFINKRKRGGLQAQPKAKARGKAKNKNKDDNLHSIKTQSRNDLFDEADDNESSENAEGVNGFDTDTSSDGEPLRDDFIDGDKGSDDNSEEEESEEEELDIEKKSRILDDEKARERADADAELH